MSYPITSCPVMFCAGRQGAILGVGVRCWLLAWTGRSIVACTVGGAPGQREARSNSSVHQLDSLSN